MERNAVCSVTRMGAGPYKSRMAAQVLQSAMQSSERDADELMGQTDCLEGCEVEPDGTCSHGWESAARTVGAV